MRQYVCQIVYLLSTFHNVTRCDKHIYEALKVPVPEADVRIIQITTSCLAQSSRMSYILCRAYSIIYKRNCINRPFSYSSSMLVCSSFSCILLATFPCLILHQSTPQPNHRLSPDLEDPPLYVFFLHLDPNSESFVDIGMLSALLLWKVTADPIGPALSSLDLGQRLALT